MKSEINGQSGREHFGLQKMALAGIIAVGAALRLWDLDRTSLWYDEAVSWSQSKGSLGELIALVAADNYPPLHNLLLWLTMPIIGDSETALRLPSAIAGILSIWLVYELGRLVFTRNTGLLAAAILAISPFHIWYSTEARMYALFAMAGLAFLIALVRTLEGDRLRWPILAAVFGALFLYSHIYAAFSMAGIGVLLLLWQVRSVRAQSFGYQDANTRTFASFCTSCLLFLPWLAVLAVRAKDVVNNGFWIAYPDGPFLKTMMRDMAGSETFFLALAATALLVLIPTRKQSAKTDVDHRAAALLAAFAIAPFIIAYGLSITLRPILFDRYLIAAWPVLILLASAGACRFLPRLGPVALLTAVVLLTIHPLRFTLLQKIRPEWREISSIYLTERKNTDALYLYKGFSAPALDYYLRSQAAFQPLAKPEDLSANSLQPLVWLLFAHASRSEMIELQERMPSQFKETGRWRSFGWGESGLTLLRFDAESGD
ncbi:glycosyltransferase family 39 protein [Roseibium polysiphoniae]|uniref:Glycosyltransferase family 39 protein n=1 Tax=Roseibium polysiphoniae TaxID=2571221 RepID=A0ABR9C8L0_9HYPH|nr:glycosyltransferase family 39 protein [Roseibium polysiphoniae]MBD8876251.1 glycosyltransferase family 39 protein [Roseibium polysiphoniae]